MVFAFIYSIDTTREPKQINHGRWFINTLEHWLQLTNCVMTYDMCKGETDCVAWLGKHIGEVGGGERSKWKIRKKGRGILKN